MTDFPGRRLLFVVNEAYFFISHRLSIALEAKARGLEVHVATPSSNSAEQIYEAGLIFHPILLNRSGLNPFQELRTLMSLIRLFRRIRPDIVHLVTIKPVIYGGVAARIANVPAVVSAVTGLGSIFTGRGPLWGLLKAMALMAYRLALGHRNSRVIVQNPNDSALLTQAGVIRDRSIILIRGSGVDLSLFRTSPEPTGEPVVVLASRMLWNKGVAEFVEAAGQLKRQGVMARFVLVGDTDLDNPTAISLKQLEDWHRSGTVEWRGHRSDMPDIFAGANLVCLPSYREGLPKVLIEAAACNRAIVATDVPGCREIVRDGENGILVPPRDAKSLAVAMKRLIEDADLRRRMGTRGRQMVEQQFTLKKVVEETLAVYRHLLL